MARLIDAHEFWNRLSHVVYDIFTVHEKDGQLTGTASVGYYTETIEEVLKQTKTVDAVEVRCAECKHYQQYHKGRTEELCEWGKCKLISMDIDMPSNGFCCFGERRNNETEEPV